MEHKDFSLFAGSRANKTDKVIESIKQYIGNLSKEDREKIQRELEQEEDTEDPSAPFKRIEFKGTSFPITSNYSIMPNRLYFLGKQKLAVIDEIDFVNNANTSPTDEAVDVKFED